MGGVHTSPKATQVAVLLILAKRCLDESAVRAARSHLFNNTLSNKNAGPEQAGPALEFLIAKARLLRALEATEELAGSSLRSIDGCHD